MKNYYRIPLFRYEFLNSETGQWQDSARYETPKSAESYFGPMNVKYRIMPCEPLVVEMPLEEAVKYV